MQSWLASSSSKFSSHVFPALPGHPAMMHSRFASPSSKFSSHVFSALPGHPVMMHSRFAYDTAVSRPAVSRPAVSFNLPGRPTMLKTRRSFARVAKSSLTDSRDEYCSCDDCKKVASDVDLAVESFGYPSKKEAEPVLHSSKKHICDFLCERMCKDQASSNGVYSLLPKKAKKRVRFIDQVKPEPVVEFFSDFQPGDKSSLYAPIGRRRSRDYSLIPGHRSTTPSEPRSAIPYRPMVLLRRLATQKAVDFAPRPKPARMLVTAAPTSQLLVANPKPVIEISKLQDVTAASDTASPPLQVTETKAGTSIWTRFKARIPIPALFKARISMPALFKVRIPMPALSKVRITVPALILTLVTMGFVLGYWFDEFCTGLLLLAVAYATFQ